MDWLGAAGEQLPLSLLARLPGPDSSPRWLPDLNKPGRWH
jgi:hypothetical protein